ncbi:MAG: CHAP domain-containing protein [Alphaproteobacteria bacterium]|nr:CHAP domain-containing protein [Alphaproteobacteria bacterium]
MVPRALQRMALPACLSLALAACATTPRAPVIPVAPTAPNVRVEIPERPLTCVPYARAHSSVELRGDAWTWWRGAEGRYARAHWPSLGAVIVFSRRGGPAGGHVAVVRAVTSAREIRVDHANWLGHGRIYLGDPVRDVSADNDWSLVNVWDSETGQWGVHDFAISGFVGPGPAEVESSRARDVPSPDGTPGGASQAGFSPPAAAGANVR